VGKLGNRSCFFLYSCGRPLFAGASNQFAWPVFRCLLFSVDLERKWMRVRLTDLRAQLSSFAHKNALLFARLKTGFDVVAHMLGFFYAYLFRKFTGLLTGHSEFLHVFGFK